MSSLSLDGRRLAYTECGRPRSWSVTSTALSTRSRMPECSFPGCPKDGLLDAGSLIELRGAPGSAGDRVRQVRDYARRNQHNYR
jgi:hypothetical protein